MPHCRNVNRRERSEEQVKDKKKTSRDWSFFSIWSGKRDLNPRLQPWQGCTLPLSYSRRVSAQKHLVCIVMKWSGKRDLNPRLQPWQGCTLPLSYSRLNFTTKLFSQTNRDRYILMERETGFEPATSTLARLHSTTELFPLNDLSSKRVYV